MHRWHRPLRLALGTFAIVFAVVVYFAIRPRPETTPPAAGARTDPKAVAESTGGVSLVAEGTKENFRVEYGRARTYEDGTLRFEKVKVVIPQRGGRGFTITAENASVTGNQSRVSMRGDVRLAASDGLAARAATATYDNIAGLVRVPGKVTFSRGHMTGRAVGATYDRERDLLWLLDQAHITFAADADGAGLEIDAGAAGLAQRDRHIRFERKARITRGGQVIEADLAVAYLAPDEDRLRTVELRGSSRIVTPDPQPGGLQAMSARDMDLGYAGDGQTLERATLKDQAAVQLAGAPSQAGRRLTGEVIDLALAPDGSTPVSLAARGAVQLDLPGEAGAPARRVRADSLDATGPPDRGLTSAQFAGKVEFRETLAAGGGSAAVDRRAQSRTLEMAVKPGFGGIDTATFGGGVTFHDGTREASAADARYDLAAGTLRLVSETPGARAGARVDDERATVQARRIDLTLDGGSLVADADVRSLLKSSPEPRPAGSARETTTGARRPGMFKDEQPVNVTAKHLDYDSTSGRALYVGEARLWQGETAVQADSLAIDDRKGDLTGKGSVRSTLRLQQASAGTGTPGQRTTVVTSDDLHYDDAARRAIYTGHARMNGPEGDLRAEKIELYLDEAGDGLERLEGYGAVALKTDARSSSGERLTYFAADERYVMSGAPVRVLEQLPQECRETIGKTLTFFRSADSITVDGNEERRTQTTSGGKCPEPRTN